MNYLGDFETSRILLDKIISEIQEHCDNSITISDEESKNLIVYICRIHESMDEVETKLNQDEC
jgi:hypothetical protein